MECSWGRLAGVHIPMGTLQQRELWDTKRQMCGSRGANCKWSKVSEKCVERCWPEDALQRTSKVSALAQRQELALSILPYSCPGLGFDRPLGAPSGWEFITRISSRSPTSSADLYAPSSSLILKKMTSEGFSQPPPPLISPTCSFFLAFPRKENSNPMHFHFPQVLPCVV